MKSADMRVQSDTGAAGALYEGHAGDLDAFVGGFTAVNNQVGAAFVVNRRLAGLEVFGSADLLARLLPKVVRGYALDALDEGQHRPAGETAVDPVAALMVLARSSATSHRAIGLGEDLRFEAPGMLGAGLIANGKVIHLTAYANTYV